jgi:hypothetical protein
VASVQLRREADLQYYRNDSHGNTGQDASPNHKKSLLGGETI